MKPLWSVILTESYAPTTGGRPYQTERTVRVELTMEEARRYALVANTGALSNQYYSIRKVE